MYAPSTREFPTRELPLFGARLTISLGGVARGALAILCIAAVVATVVAARYLIFEYTHGDHHVVERLINGGKS